MFLLLNLFLGMEGDTEEKEEAHRLRMAKLFSFCTEASHVAATEAAAAALLEALKAYPLLTPSQQSLLRVTAFNAAYEVAFERAQSDGETFARTIISDQGFADAILNSAKSVAPQAAFAVAKKYVDDQAAATAMLDLTKKKGKATHDDGDDPQGRLEQYKLERKATIAGMDRQARQVENKAVLLAKLRGLAVDDVKMQDLEQEQGGRSLPQVCEDYASSHAMRAATKVYDEEVQKHGLPENQILDHGFLSETLDELQEVAYTAAIAKAKEVGDEFEKRGTYDANDCCDAIDKASWEAAYQAALDRAGVYFPQQKWVDFDEVEDDMESHFRDGRDLLGSM